MVIILVSNNVDSRSVLWNARGLHNVNIVKHRGMTGLGNSNQHDTFVTGWYIVVLLNLSG